jgi:hypothetical protein
MGQKVDLWLVYKQQDGHSLDTGPVEGDPGGQSPHGYEPAGPWEPFATGKWGVFTVVHWRRPFQKTKSGLEQLAEVKQDDVGSAFLGRLRTLLDF